jgi:hypothetical protein
MGEMRNNIQNISQRTGREQTYAYMLGKPKNGRIISTEVLRSVGQ